MFIARFFVGATILASSMALAAEAIRVQPLEEPGDVARLPVLPLVDWERPDWNGAKAVYDHSERGRRYQVWIGAAERGLVFHVIVNDPDHSREFREREIWRGDCIFIGLDGRDDTRGDELKTAAFGLDDCSYIFAYGKDGPDAYIDKTGNPAITRADLLKMIRQISRDDAAQVTRYDIAIPWSALGSAWGQSPSVGVAMTFKDAVPSEEEDVDWGAIRTWDRGRVFNRFALPDGGGEVFTFAPKVQRMKHEGDCARLVLAGREATGGEVTVRLGEEKKQIAIPPQKGIARWEVAIPIESTRLGNRQVEASLSHDGKVVRESVQLESPAILYAQVAQRIAKLLENPPHELVRTHLRSTMKVIDSVYQNLDTPGDRHVDEAELFMSTMNVILQKLPQERFDWERHLRQALPLVFAFISSRDNTLQFYSVQLPYGWQAEKRYPVVFYLHGSGSPNPMGGLLNCFDNSGQDTLFREVDIDPAHVPAGHQGFLVAPWCRGNSMYREAAESDFWQIMDLIKQQFKVDEDRMYLTGFSMGGGGTWALAGRRPDVWAGVCPASGFWSGSDANLDYLTDNLRGVPVKVWCGELDAMMMPGAKVLLEKLQKRGFTYDCTIAPKMPHTYPYLAYQENLAWLMQHSRKRPSEWTYTSDTPRHAGTRGIEMNVPTPPWQVNPEKLPRYACRIEGNVVTVSSANTPGISVELGEKGLGLKGTVTLIWNGQQVYMGEPKRVTAGDFPARRW